MAPCDFRRILVDNRVRVSLGRSSQAGWNHEKREARIFINISGKTVFHETFQTPQGRTGHAVPDLRPALSSPASAGKSGFWKQRGAQYPTLGQLSRLGFLAAAGSSPAAGSPFRPHPGLRSKRHDQHPAQRRHPRHRHLPSPGAVGSVQEKEHGQWKLFLSESMAPWSDRICDCVLE